MEHSKTAIADCLIDNDRVRVTQYRFSPGSETKWHLHEWDYVVIPLLFKKIRCTGECYMNDNSFEVEIKSNYYEKLKEIYNIYDFDEYPSIEEEVSKVIRCILDYCDQENRYDLINSQNII